MANVGRATTGKGFDKSTESIISVAKDPSDPPILFRFRKETP